MPLLNKFTFKIVGERSKKKLTKYLVKNVKNLFCF